MIGGNTFASAGPQISVAPETLFHIGPIPITNSLLYSFIGYLLIVAIFLLVASQIKKGSRSLFVHAVIWVYETLYKTCESVLGSPGKAKAIAPLAITIFFTVVINNWLGILPIVGPIQFNGLPLFRGFAADLNSTFALAIISMVAVQIWAIKTHGFFGNLKRYLHNPFVDPLHFFEGFLEMLAELSRLVALSMRLFGNILGGEILLIVLYYVSGFGAPLILPVFMVLELFVGTVQAYVFFMLTIVFISIGISEPEDGHKENDSSDQAGTKSFANLSKIDSR